MAYLTPSACRWATATDPSLFTYRSSRTGLELCLESAAVVRKWYGVVPDASKNRPSIEPMQPSVQCGSSIRAIVVPYWPLSSLFSHIARPQPFVVAEPGHGLHDVVVLGVLGATLVADEVVPGPAVALRVGAIGALQERAPRVHVLVMERRAAVAWQDLEHEAEDDQHGEANRAGGDGPGEPADRLADLPVAPRVDEQADDLDDADHHQQVAEEVQQRQQPRVPQQADDRQALLRGVDAGDGEQPDDPERRAVDVPPRHTGDEADDGERRDEEVERCGQREEHVVERVVRALRPGAVLHVRHEVVVGQERPDPERRQQDDAQADGQMPNRSASIRRC